MTDQMPQVNAEFGTTPVIEFPTPEAPKGLKVVELTEGDGPIVRRGDTVTVNYHGVVWGKDTPFDSSFDRHQPASFGIGVGQVIKGWDQTVPGHNVGSRLVVSIPPEYGYGSRGIPQALSLIHISPPSFSSETAKAKRSTHAASEDSSTASLRRLSRRSTSEFEARRRYILRGTHIARWP